jgi:hypothetical protein
MQSPKPTATVDSWTGSKVDKRPEDNRTGVRRLRIVMTCLKIKAAEIQSTEAEVARISASEAESGGTETYLGLTIIEGITLICARVIETGRISMSHRRASGLYRPVLTLLKQKTPRWMIPGSLHHHLRTAAQVAHHPDVDEVAMLIMATEEAVMQAYPNVALLTAPYPVQARKPGISFDFDFGLQAISMLLQL